MVNHIKLVNFSTTVVLSVNYLLIINPLAELI